MEYLLDTPLMAGEISSAPQNPDEADARPSVPRPGGIYDPVARTLDAIGDRWSLVLVRHLLLAPRGFQELRQRTGIAPRVLSSRLRELRANGFVESVESGGYQLTERGRRAH